MLLVGNGTLLTMGPKPRVIERGAVLVEGERVSRVGGTDELRALDPAATYIDAGGRLIMPGLINAHAHLYSAFAQGMAESGMFTQTPQGTGWKLSRELSLADTYYSAMLHLIEGIKHGITSVIAHHSSPGAVRGSLPALAKAAGDVGVRACFCYEVSDRDGEKDTLEGILENAGFLLSCQESSGLLHGLFGIHPGLSDESLRNCRTVAKKFDAGFHLHAVLGGGGRKKGGESQRGFERLDSFGILGPETIAAHFLQLNGRELELLQRSGTWVVYNPQLGSGEEAVPVREMLTGGIGVALGTDIYCNDMFESARRVAGSPGACAADISSVLYRNNPRLASGLFGGVLGELVPGALADIIIVDCKAAIPPVCLSWQKSLVDAVSGSCVETTIVNGQVKMLERRLVELDENEVYVIAREYAAKLWYKITEKC